MGLDTEGYAISRFVKAVEGEKLIGAARAKVFPNCIEICSVGVLEPYRGKGIGKKMMEKLVSMFSVKPIFLVTDIPFYFHKVGFKKANHFPLEMEAKRNRCLQELDCELAEVMLYERREKSE